MFGHELGVLPEAVAGALDLHDHGVMEQAVQQCGGDDGVTKHLAPFGKAAVAGQDHGAALVAGVDQLKKQVPGDGANGQVANLVNDQQLRPAEKADALTQPSLAVGLGQAVDDIGERREIDRAPGADRLDPERRMQPLAVLDLVDEPRQIDPTCSCSASFLR